MLWNNIYEFFIKYIFGGYWNGCEYSALIGDLYAVADGDWIFMNTNHFIAITFTNNYGDNVAMTFGNYLSLIATIISIIIILVLMCLIVKKIFNIIFRLFTGQGVF